MRSRSDIRGPSSQIILGVLVVAIGVLFLLDNFGFVDFSYVLGFWPLVFIVIGVVKLFDTSSPNGYVIGIVLIALGLTMVLNRLGWFYLSWRMVWPLLLIAIGALLVFRATVGRRQAPPLKDGAAEEVLDITAILGGVQRRIVVRDFRHGEVTAIVGGCTIDLQGSTIQAEAVLDVFALFGGITLRVPSDWAVVLDGTPVLGGFDDRTAAPAEASQRLIVRGYAIMGGVDVRN
ncbi:LiaI-LiaF-like domain-containing protein [Massilia horti]|uniref:LiaF transmembrane domain-containing protein n=1 Tax=Massilia horti TaxID=2562153 RepID=A0A4Y9T219_9BURK|nr:DUF5668 domain-containing protein [Massilia horti]TFW33385.1 hypothetical protein E4O92_06970 [Massilia horti]